MRCVYMWISGSRDFLYLYRKKKSSFSDLPAGGLVKIVGWKKKKYIYIRFATCFFLCVSKLETEINPRMKIDRYIWSLNIRVG